MPRPRAIEDQILLPKAMLLFWRNGYARTGIRELEETLGLKAPSLYNRFGSKEALFQAALGHYLDTVVRGRIRRYLQADDVLAGLREFFDSTYETGGSGESAIGCLLVNTAREMGAELPGVSAQLARGGLMIRAAFRAALRRAQRERALRTDADPRALANALYLGLQGLLVESKVVRDKAVLRQRTDALFSLLPASSGSRAEARASTSGLRAQARASTSGSRAEARASTRRKD